MISPPLTEDDTTPQGDRYGAAFSKPYLTDTDVVQNHTGSHTWVIDVLQDLQRRGCARLVWRWMEWFDYNRNSRCGD